MINNSGTSAKHSASFLLDNTLGVKGAEEYPVFAETQVRLEVTGVAGGNVITIEGRIVGSPNWTIITTRTGAGFTTVDTSLVDFIRYRVSTIGGSGNAYASGFFLK